MAESVSETTTATDVLTSSSTHSATARESNPSTITSYSTTILSVESTSSFILGPLTTTFTAPTQCSQAYWASDSYKLYNPTIGQACSSIGGEIAYNQEDDCLPPVNKFTVIASPLGTSVITSTIYQYEGYYSPGIACPAGYTTACAVQGGTNGIQSALPSFQSFQFLYSALANETAVGCCPQSYKCQNLVDAQWCQQIIPATTTQPLVTCMNASNSASASTTHFTLPTVVLLTGTGTATPSVVTETVPVSTLAVLATMIQLNFRATDLPTTSSLLPSPSSSSPSSTSTSLSSSSTGTSSSSSNHKTTTIAVGIVIPCVAVLIAAGLGWFWYRRRSKKRLSPSYRATQPTEPSDMDYRATGVPSELAGDSSRFEVAGTVPQYEMVGTDSRTVVHEMYAGDNIQHPKNENLVESHDDSK